MSKPLTITNETYLKLRALREHRIIITGKIVTFDQLIGELIAKAEV